MQWTVIDETETKKDDVCKILKNGQTFGKGAESNLNLMIKTNKYYYNETTVLK
jgi:hypothetical protein